MDICRNICVTCRASLAKIRNVVTRIPGSTFFIAALIALCLTVPSFTIEPYSVQSPAKSSKSGNSRGTQFTNITQTHSKDSSTDKRLDKRYPILTHADHSSGKETFEQNERISGVKVSVQQKEDHSRNQETVKRNEKIDGVKTPDQQKEDHSSNKETVKRNEINGVKIPVQQKQDHSSNKETFERNEKINSAKISVQQTEDHSSGKETVKQNDVNGVKMSVQQKEDHSGGKETDKRNEINGVKTSVQQKEAYALMDGTESREGSCEVILQRLRGYMGINENENSIKAHVKEPKTRDIAGEKSFKPVDKDDVQVPTINLEQSIPKVSIIELNETVTVIPHIEESSDTNEGLTFHEFKQSRTKTKDTKQELQLANPYLTHRGQRKYGLLGREDMLAADRKCKQTLPEAIIIGVMKAGTEAFSNFLAINPQVAMSLNVRSTLFFTSTYSKGLSWYRQQMACKTDEQTTIEKAPQYFPNAYAPQRIFKMNKDIKLILLVRNPIDRAMSHYLQVKNSHPGQVNGKSFEDIVFTRTGAVNPNNKYIYLSKYSLILKRWLKYFKLSQILILNGDEFKDNQTRVLAKAESFLGIRNYITEDKFLLDKAKGFYCLNVNGSPACLGSGKGREHPALSKADYQKLKIYFRPYNNELSRIAKQTFDW